MNRMWKVRERLATISAGIVVLSAGLVLSASAIPPLKPAGGIVLKSGGRLTMLYPVEGESAIAYSPGGSVDEMNNRILADAQTAGWQVVHAMPDYAMAIVKTAPDKALLQASRVGVPLVNTYPVFHCLADPALPVIATDQVFVQFKDGVTDARGQGVLKEYGLQFVKKGPGPAWLVLAPVSGADVISLARVIDGDPLVKWAEPNLLMGVRLAMAAPLPNDPLIGNQWHLENTKYNTLNSGGDVNADCDIYRFWHMFGANNNTMGQGVVVAVIDTGVDLNHEDLKNNLVPGWDFVDDDQTPNPDLCTIDDSSQGDCAHGTCCAGIIAAENNNALGVSGVAPKAKIMPIRIFLEPPVPNGYTVVSEQRVADAIHFAVDHGADVISNSWGGPLSSTIIGPAFDYGLRNGRGGLGTIAMASSGNEFSQLDFPAAYNNVISVGAISDKDIRVSYSNAGPNLDVVAPSQDIDAGYTVDYIDFTKTPPVLVSRFVALPYNEDRTGIWTTDITGIYGFNPGLGSTLLGDPAGNYFSEFNGTSASCPVAAGCVALLLGVNPGWDFVTLRHNIDTYADPAGEVINYFDPEDPIVPNGNLCDAIGFNPDLGYGRINPFRVQNQIKKPFPFRNVAIAYETNWNDFSDADKWTTASISPTKFPVYLGEDDQGNPIEDTLDKWVLTVIGWVETPPFNLDTLPKVPTNLASKYPYQEFLQNPLGRYVPGADELLISPPIDTLASMPQEYAVLMVTHRYSMETLGQVELPTGGVASEMDEGRVEMSVNGGSWTLLNVVRGSSAHDLGALTDPLATESNETLYDQSFPLGKISDLFPNGRDGGSTPTIKFRFRFMSNSLHDPAIDFGWTIQKVKLVAYDMYDDDYKVTSAGKMPDWSSDSRSIYFTTPDSKGIVVNSSYGPTRWQDGTLCASSEGDYLGSPEGAPMTGMDFSPITDRIAASYNNTTAGNQYITAVQSMNSDIIDGQPITLGTNVDARDVRYSSDESWVTFTDGLYSIYLTVADGGMQTPIQLGSEGDPLIYYPPGGEPQELTNIGHPVFAFEDQRIVFEAGTTTNPDVKQLYILHRGTRRVERKLIYFTGGSDQENAQANGRWSQVSEKMADVANDSGRLVFVANAQTTSGDIATSDRLFILNNLQSVVLAGTDPDLYLLDPTLPKGYVGPDMFGWPRFSPDNSRIVYTLDDAVRIRKFPSNIPAPPTPPPASTPTPVPTPVETPTPTATPVGQAITFDGQVDFTSPNTGWYYQSTGLPTFADATLTKDPNAGYTLRSYNNTNTFGYLSSPFISASVSVTTDPVSGYLSKSLTLIRWWVSGQITPGFSPSTAVSLPDFRLRATSLDNQDTQLIEVNTEGDGHLLPSLDPTNPTPYDLLLSPAPGLENRSDPTERFVLAFDLLNFNPANDPNGALSLRKIEYYRVPGEVINTTEVPPTEFTFDNSLQGWQLGYPMKDGKPVYSVPWNLNYPVAPVVGALELNSQNNNTNTFGYYFDDNVPTSTSTSLNRLWKLDWEVYTYGTDATTVPSFRLRAGTSDNEMQTIRRLSSTGSADLIPRFTPVGKERIYTTYLRPITQRAAPLPDLPGKINLAFDMLNFDPKDDPSGNINLGSLKISVVEIPNYP